jgi:hypothetical protein
MAHMITLLTRIVQLGNSLAQNCGPKIHRELASRSFTDALLRLANDRVCILVELVD